MTMDEPAPDRAPRAATRGAAVRMSQLRRRADDDLTGYVGRICHNGKRGMETVVIVDVTRRDWGIMTLAMHSPTAARSVPLCDLLPSYPTGTMVTTSSALGRPLIARRVVRPPQGFSPDDHYEVDADLVPRSALADEAVPQLTTLDDVPTVFTAWVGVLDFPMLSPPNDTVFRWLHLHSSLTLPMISSMWEASHRRRGAFRARVLSPDTALPLRMPNPLVRQLAYLVTTQLRPSDPQQASAQVLLRSQLDGACPQSVFRRLLAIAVHKHGPWQTRDLVVQQRCKSKSLQAYRDVTRCSVSLKQYLMPFLALLPQLGCSIERRDKAAAFTIAGCAAMLDVVLPLCLGAADSMVERCGGAGDEQLRHVLHTVECVATHYRSIKSSNFV